MYAPTTPLQPLSHHEILALVAPFSRQGQQVDMAASDRAQRRLMFKPQALPDAAPGGAGGQHSLQLEVARDGSHSLTRVLQLANGLQARLQARGPDTASLLARVMAVPPEALFSAGPGWLLARSYDCGHVAAAAATTATASAPTSPAAFASAAGTAGLTAAPAAAASPGVLQRAELQLDGLQLVLTLLPVRGAAAEISLKPSARPGHPATLPAWDLPEDLLAVLGWDWARLVPAEDGWTTRLRLRGAVPRRSRQAELALLQVAQHLARVLAESPAQFHRRHGLARWGVVLRRMIPTLTAVGLIAAALALPKLALGEHAGLWVVLHYLPIGLLALSFSLQELPRFEVPRWPRASRAASWRRGQVPAPLTEGRSHAA